MYLVYIALAAVTLGSRWTWTIGGALGAGYAMLFAIAPPADPHAAHQPADDLSGHLAGMWVAFLSAAVLIGFFVTRVREALDERERALAEARRLARGAGAPGVADHPGGRRGPRAGDAAGDHRRGVEGTRARSRSTTPTQSELTEDARLIRAQVERCRQILDHMSGRADASTVDPPAPIDPRPR